MLQNLPAPLKRRIRLSGCRLIAIWRRYPRRPRRLPAAQAAGMAAALQTWQTSTTPIPDRGDETTRANRRHNLTTAIEAINHRLIAPSESFSLVQMLGEPSQANGYRAGPVFVGGQVLSDAGGGLCLIATNLYQLFLYSGCRIIERHNHSIDAYGQGRFYELGEDAAIAYSYKDLVIRNPFQVPLLLCIELRDHDVQSRLLAPGSRSLQVMVRSQILERHPAAPGQTHPGWSVATSRFCRSHGSRQWRQDYLSFSEYKPC